MERVASIEEAPLAAEAVIRDTAAEAPAEAWNPVTKLLFRFAFAYLLLYNLPFPLDQIPGVALIEGPYRAFWDKIVLWVGKHLFHVEITFRPAGSGDTTWNYIQVFCFLVIAAVATLLWTLADRRRANYARLHQWLNVYVRYSLALTMISYGAAKVIKTQFPNPSLDRMLQPFGDASPMGLLWTFMGASMAFNIFTGGGEMVGGLLVAVRRTTLLGALVIIAVMSNVVVLNFSYDVPVKLYSAHLLAMAVFLTLPHWKRLANLLLFNRTAEPEAPRPLFARPWVNRGAAALGALLVLLFTGQSLIQAQQGRRAYGDLSPRSPLYGVWTVEEFEVDGVAHPPLITDKERWRRVVFDSPRLVGIQLMSDARQRYNLVLDTTQRTLALTKREDPAWKTTIKYEQAEPEKLSLEGMMDGKKIRARLQRSDPKQFLLVNRGFHWINEFPFNR